MKVANFLMDISIILLNFSERMMFMGSVTTENGVKIEVSNLSVVYANCIMWGAKSFTTCPARLKLDTAIILIINGYPELVTNEEYLAQAQEKIAEAEANM